MNLEDRRLDLIEASELSDAEQRFLIGRSRGWWNAAECLSEFLGK